MICTHMERIWEERVRHVSRVAHQHGVSSTRLARAGPRGAGSMYRICMWMFSLGCGAREARPGACVREWLGREA